MQGFLKTALIAGISATAVLDNCYWPGALYYVSKGNQPTRRDLYVTNGHGGSNAPRARWAVMWVYTSHRRRKLARKDFGDDYASAEALYQKARDAGKPYITLACVNMGFPPPMELRPRTVRKKGRIKGTRKIKIVTIEVDPLKELNIQGKLWCPYCRAIREFVLSKQSNVNGIKFINVRYICPICKVPHTDFNVRQWNRTAALHMDNVVTSKTTRRRPQGTTTRRRNSRT